MIFVSLRMLNQLSSLPDRLRMDLKSGIAINSKTERREVLQFAFDFYGKQLHSCTQNTENFKTLVSLLEYYVANNGHTY